jgi:hypothetical protein
MTIGRSQWRLGADSGGSRGGAEWGCSYLLCYDCPCLILHWWWWCGRCIGVRLLFNDKITLRKIMGVGFCELMSLDPIVYHLIKWMLSYILQWRPSLSSYLCKTPSKNNKLQFLEDWPQIPTTRSFAHRTQIGYRPTRLCLQRPTTGLQCDVSL